LDAVFSAVVALALKVSRIAKTVMSRRDAECSADEMILSNRLQSQLCGGYGHLAGPVGDDVFHQSPRPWKPPLIPSLPR
jgi:hypothetical protein